MANRYWVGNSGNINDSAHWSTSSGGGGGASVPNNADNVFIDTNSFSATGHTITVPINSGIYTANFTVTSNDTFTIHQQDNSFINITQDLTFNDKLSVTRVGVSAYISMYTDTAVDITWGNATVNTNFFLQSNGLGTPTFTLQDNITSLSNIGLFGVGSGNFVSNGKTLSAGHVYNYGGSADWTGSTVNCNLWNMQPAHTIIEPPDLINLEDNGSGLTQFSGNTSDVYKDVSVNSGTSFELFFSSTFENFSVAIGIDITVYPGYVYYFINPPLISGNAGNIRTINSYTPGSRFGFSSADGENMTFDYIDLQDSRAMEVGKWWAGDNSVDSGNNPDWNFSDIIYTLDIDEEATEESEGELFYESAEMDINSGDNGLSLGIYLSAFQPLPQKDYEHRVFDHDGNFVGIWANVTSDFGYEQGLNQNATELTVDIARSPENRVVVFEPLQDEDGNNILDENSDTILVQTEAENSVGPGTDVDLNLNVDVYAFYGGYEQLLDENSDPILDENSDPILVQFGNPNGKRVYSGYIADFELVFGSPTGVRVIVVSHATEASHHIFKAPNGNTTVSYLNTDPVQMARDAMDSYIDEGGRMAYTNNSMPLSGTDTDYDFKLQTTRESIDKTIDLLPSEYYHFPDVGENTWYLLSKGETADHTFYYQKHINELVLRKSLTQLVNDVYVVGGDTGAGDLFKHYEDATSQSDWRKGLARISDSRVSLDTSAQILGEGKIDSYKEPRWRTQVRIIDTVYDIESINLGEMVGFKNFGNYVDDLILQIVQVKHEKHAIVLDLDMLVPDDTKRLEELKKNIQSEEIRDIGDAPS